MAFDLSSAQPADSGGGFDLATAKPAGADTPAPSAKPPANLSGIPGFGLAETLGNMGSSMIAKPVSDIAGLGAIPLHAAGLINTPPEDVKAKVQSGLTYEPRTQEGANFIKYNPLNLVGKAVGYGADKLSGAVKGDNPGPVRDALGNAVHEGVEQLPNFIGAKGAGKLAEGAEASAAAAKLKQGNNAVQDATRDAAQKAGYITPAEGGVKGAITGLTGKARNEKAISAKNEETATTKLAGEVGIPEGTAISKESLGERMREQYKAYDAVTGAMPKLEPTPTFKSSIQDSLTKVDEALARNPVANANLKGPQRLLRSYLKQGEFPSGATMADIQNLRKWAKDDFRKGDSEMGTARLGVASKLEDLFEENLTAAGKPDAIAAFKAARVNLAKLHLLDRVTEAATGKVDLQKLGALSKSKAYQNTLTGEFKTAADFARAYPKAARRGEGAAQPKLSLLDSMFAMGSLAAGHWPLAIAKLGGSLGGPALSARGMLQGGTPAYGGAVPPGAAAMTGFGLGNAGTQQ